jgi:hypothetical protein
MPVSREDDSYAWEDEPQGSDHNYAESSRVYRRLKSSVEPHYHSNKALWDELTDHLDDARINADDTVMEHKKERPSQKFWDTMLTGSLASKLSYSDPSKKAVAHWKKHGVEW